MANRDGAIHVEETVRGGWKMFKSRWLAVTGASVVCLGGIWLSNAQAPAQEATYPLYCRGPLNTLRTDGGKTIKTPFRWAKESALKERPGAGQCAWAASPPPGFESKPGDSAAIVGNLGPFDTFPVNTIGKFCVTYASGEGNYVVDS